MFYVKYPSIYTVIKKSDAVTAFPMDEESANLVTYLDESGQEHTEECAPTFLHDNRDDAESMLAWITENHRQIEAELERRRKFWNEE